MRSKYSTSKINTTLVCLSVYLLGSEITQLVVDESQWNAYFVDSQEVFNFWTWCGSWLQKATLFTPGEYRVCQKFPGNFDTL